MASPSLDRVSLVRANRLSKNSAACTHSLHHGCGRFLSMRRPFTVSSMMPIALSTPPSWCSTGMYVTSIPSPLVAAVNFFESSRKTPSKSQWSSPTIVCRWHFMCELARISFTQVTNNCRKSVLYTVLKTLKHPVDTSLSTKEYFSFFRPT